MFRFIVELFPGDSPPGGKMISYLLVIVLSVRSPPLQGSFPLTLFPWVECLFSVRPFPFLKNAPSRLAFSPTSFFQPTATQSFWQEAGVLWELDDAFLPHCKECYISGASPFSL